MLSACLDKWGGSTAEPKSEGQGLRAARNPLTTGALAVKGACSPAATARGMESGEMRAIASWILAALRERDSEGRIASIAGAVEELCARFPVPGL